MLEVKSRKRDKEKMRIEVRERLMGASYSLSATYRDRRRELYDKTKGVKTCRRSVSCQKGKIKQLNRMMLVRSVCQACAKENDSVLMRSDALAGRCEVERRWSPEAHSESPCAKNNISYDPMYALYTEAMTGAKALRYLMFAKTERYM